MKQLPRLAGKCIFETLHNRFILFLSPFCKFARVNVSIITQTEQNRFMKVTFQTFYKCSLITVQCT